MTDPRLGRVEQFDERSRQYPIRALIGTRAPRSYTWRPRTTPLDQGREGSCVGMAWAHELAARPHVVPVTEVTAVALYRRAQRLDPWPGEAPAYEGTSVLAGVKAAQELGFYPAYRWCFGAAYAVSLKGGFVSWQNSWGPSYGKGGIGRLRFADLDRLLREDGEACAPTRR